MSQIKINRALALAAVGRYPATADAMLAHVPADLVAALSSRQLARVLDAMDACANRSKAIAMRDACDEGAIWDARQQALREVAA